MPMVTSLIGLIVASGMEVTNHLELVAKIMNQAL
jgi:hypothetical protein